MKKRLLSLLLVLVMILGMIPATALTASALGLADFYTTIRVGDNVYDVATTPQVRGDGYFITSTGLTELVIELTNYNGGPIYIESSNQLVSGERVFPKIVVKGNCVINVPYGYDGYGIEYYSLYATPGMDIEFDDGDASLTIQGGGTGAVKVSGSIMPQVEPQLDVTGPVGSSFKVNMESGEGVVVCHSDENYAFDYGKITFGSDVNVQILVPLDQLAFHATFRRAWGAYVKKPGADGVNYSVKETSSYAKGYGVLWLDTVAIDSPEAWYEPSKPGSSVLVQNDNNTSRDTLDLLEGIYYEGNTIGRFTPFSGYMKDDFLYNSDGTMFRVGHDTVDVDLYGLRVYDIVNQCYVEPRDQWFAMKLLPAGMYIQEYSYDVLCTKVLLDSAYIGFPTEEGKLNLTLDGQTMQHVKAIGHVPGTYGNLNDTSRSAATPELGQAIRVNSPVYYVYDEKPEIKSVKVNGKGVADGATVTVNSGSVAIKTTYDSTLSQALTDYGCTVKSYAKYSLNGEVLNKTVVPALPNGDGTSTTIAYNRTLNPGDELTVESWLEVTWPDGSTDRVDQCVTNVVCRSLGFASQNPKMPGESTTAARETLRLGASKTYSFTAEALSANSPYSLTTGIVIYNETENKTVYSSAGDLLSRSLDISDYITETGKYYVMEEIVLWKNGERIDALRHIFPLTIVKEALPSVAANVTVPVFEGTPSDAVLRSESQSDCTITKTEWYKRDTFGNETKIDSTHSFEVNGRYRCYVTFAPVAGTYFSSATAVYINGEKATLSGSIGDTAAYYVTYDVNTDKLPVLLTDDSFPKTGSSMTVDIEAMAELSDDIMEAYFNGEISVEWYVDGTRVESAPTSDFGEKLEVKAEYNGKEVYAKFIYGSKSLTGKTYTITGEVCTIGFDANGGSNASAHSAVALTKGSAYTLPECKFTAPAGYVFKAWEVNGVEYAPGAKITVNDNVTAVAVWKAEVTGDVLIGDVNLDGQVNAVDSNLLKRSVAGEYMIDAGSPAAENADINGDGQINSIDSNLLKRMVAGEYKP